MNERIRELLSQAGVHYEVMPKDTVYEKFAELIVQECISIAQDRAAFDWAAPNDVNHIISEIKEHFGVEE
jgi:hypothetical protein